MQLFSSLAAFTAILGAFALPQTRTPLELVKPSAIQYATFVPGVSGEPAKPGRTVTLWLDVVPKPGINIYAAGTHQFLKIALTTTSGPAFKVGSPKYPASELVFFPVLKSSFPVYRKSFRITQPLTINKSAAPGPTLDVQGVVDYQACDEQICYLPSSTVVRWVVKTG